MLFTGSLRFPSPPTHPLPPPTPCPWLWRCHACHIWYRLATTRRCLECDHDFCLSANTSSSSSSAKPRRRSAGGPCRAEFDYIGWAARGAWRRTLLLNSRTTRHDHGPRPQPDDPSSLGARQSLPTTPTPTTSGENDDEKDGGLLLPTSRRWLPQSALTTAWGDEHRALEHGIEQLTDRFAEKKEALQVRRRHNCWLHCDFPSECHHAVHKARQEGRPVLSTARAMDEAYLVNNNNKAREECAAGWKRPSSAKKVSVRFGRSLRHNPSGRSGSWGRSLEEEEEDDENDESSDSDSDSSDSDFDRIADEEDVSQPASPPTEDEVVEGQKPVAVPAFHTSLDMEGDCSYAAFQKATGIDSSPACISPPTTPPKSTTDADDLPSPVSPPVSPITSSATTSPIPIPTKTPATLLGAATASEDPIATLRSENYHTTIKAHLFSSYTTTTTTTHISQRIHQQLEQAYSAQAWFAADKPTIHHHHQTAEWL